MDTCEGTHDLPTETRPAKLVALPNSRARDGRCATCGQWVAVLKNGRLAAHQYEHFE